MKRSFLLLGVLLFLYGCGGLNAGREEEQLEPETSPGSTCEFGDLKCLIGFEFGDLIDKDRVWTIGRYFSGGMQYYLKTDLLRRYTLFFESPDGRLTSIIAVDCNFFGIKLGEARIADVEAILGPPDSYIKNDVLPYGGSDFTIPDGYSAYYSFDDQTSLYIEFDEDQLAQNLFYKGFEKVVDPFDVE